MQTFTKIYVNYITNSLADAKAIKEIENVTNHDVKAVEYFIKEAFDHLEISEYKEFIHFGLTSQDINNTATPLMIKESIEEIFVPTYMELLNKLVELKDEWIDVPLLARTHGQAASPTRLGKEVLVFIERLEKQMGLMNTIPSQLNLEGLQETLMHII